MSTVRYIGSQRYYSVSDWRAHVGVDHPTTTWDQSNDWTVEGLDEAQTHYLTAVLRGMFIDVSIPPKADLAEVLYDKQYRWQLVPGSDVPAASLAEPGPIVWMDENAGALIGDIAYVVSGYPYAASGAQAYAARASADLKFEWNEGDHVIELLPGEAIVRINGMIVDQFNEGYTTDMLIAVEPVAITLSVVLGDHKASWDGDLAVVDGSYLADYCWPFLERFDLTTKQWLPRIPMPRTSKTETYSFFFNTPGTKHAGPWVMSAGVLPTGSPDVVFITDWTGATIARVGPGDDAAPFPAGVYYVLTSATGVDPCGSPEPIGDALGVRADDTTFLIRPYAGEGGIAGVIDGKLYFGGGDGEFIIGTEFFSFDPATETFETLTDMPEDHVADYAPYGVIDGKLWYIPGFTGATWLTRCYDPATDEWTEGTLAAPAAPSGVPRDQIQGFEVDGKLYFWDPPHIYEFDAAALTVVEKTPCPNTSIYGQPFLIDDKIHVFQQNGLGDPPNNWIYDPATDVWTVREDVAVSSNSDYANQFVGVTHQGTPYLLSAVNYADLTLGVYELAGILDQPRGRVLGDLNTQALITARQRLHMIPFTIDNAGVYVGTLVALSISQEDGAFLSGEVIVPIPEGGGIHIAPMVVGYHVRLAELYLRKIHPTDFTTNLASMLFTSATNFSNGFSLLQTYDPMLLLAVDPPSETGGGNLLKPGQGAGLYAVQLFLYDVESL